MICYQVAVTIERSYGIIIVLELLDTILLDGSLSNTCVSRKLLQ